MKYYQHLEHVALAGILGIMLAGCWILLTTGGWLHTLLGIFGAFAAVLFTICLFAETHR